CVRDITITVFAVDVKVGGPNAFDFW
nr:immunoglobulin heavy chain junction region [Macaca mulatta]MOV40507.1 immunoglobulin heavy chain junction region [Macaca mulatta]MOV43064.1 immunoglobulin heavy chain junction region [Macaca mulatta]MOV44490.1 immunoglobulin heavy chain junction region [Macaca mulatta]